MATRPDYYKALGVDKKAGAEEIKKAYRKLARRYHPDRNPDDKKAEERFKEVRDSLESEDPAEINAKTEALQTAFHAVSEAMYQRAQEQTAQAGNGASSDGAASSTSEDEDVVDAEVVDEPKA